MALVRDDCFVPTLDAPELGYIRESTSEQYVPDVFYKVPSTYIYIYIVHVDVQSWLVPHNKAA